MDARGIWTTVCAALGMIGGFLAQALGGWNTAVETMMIFMGIDYITGLIVALVFHNSPKTEHGGAESKAGFKGLVRKCFMIVLVLIASRLDMLLGTTFVRDSVIIAFIVNEALSIVENAGLMGIPMPKPLINAIELLKKKAEEPE